jgi:UDP-N-acetylmuramoyl-tripeptide--D-alanyl-D-alanine ligase
LSLMKTSGRKIVVLADMLELGRRARSEHRAIGEFVTKLGFRYLFTFGARAKAIYRAARVQVGIHYTDKKRLAKDLRNLLRAGDILLVKGSRGMRMEDVITTVQSLPRNA